MHDVFISYKSEDSAVALRVRDTLEKNGIMCWIAERDISGGSNYAADIPAAIAQCRVLVLILTNAAQESPWIMKELDSAIAGRKLILPLKIGYFEINKTMSFLLAGVQYYDATTNPDETMKALVRRIRKAIANNEGGEHRKTQQLNVPKSHGGLILLFTAAIILGGLHYFGIVDLEAFVNDLPGLLERLPTILAEKFAEMVTYITEKMNAG